MNTTNIKILDESWNVAFQGLRGYAILLIFISHCNINGENSFKWLGAFGVSIFIMLSGYLLMMHYYNAQLPKPLELLKKRLKKLYFLHLITLLFAIPFSLKDIIEFGTINYLITLALNIFLMQAWFPFDRIYFSYNAVSWYLSLMVFLVLVSPNIIKFFRHIKGKMVMVLFILCIVFEFDWCLMTERLPYAHWLIYILPIVRIVDYLIGCEIFLLKKDKIDCNRVQFLLIYAGIWAIIVAGLSLDSTSEFYSASLWALPSAILVYALAEKEKISKVIKFFFMNKVMIFIGNISFEFFLIHQLINRYLIVIFNQLKLSPRTILMYAVSLGISICLSYFYRKLERLLKNRWAIYHG